MPAILAWPGAAISLQPQYVELLAAAAQSSTAVTPTSEMVVVDPSVAGWESLVENLAGDSGRSFHVLVIDPTRDGVEQLTAALGAYQDLSAVHILSHGAEGTIALGTSLLTEQTIAQWQSDFVSWNGHLAAGADLLFYACDVAGSGDGARLLKTIADWTGADVAGSSDRTGAVSLGGDWTLEVHTGTVQTPGIVAQEWQHTLALATFQQGVNSYAGTADTYLDSQNPGSVRGTEDQIYAQTTGGAVQTLLRFDAIFGNGPGQIPLGAQIDSASLVFNVTNPASGARIDVHQMLVAWNESSTWTSLGAGIQRDGVEAASAADGTATASGSTGSFTISGLETSLQSWANGNANQGWVILSNGAKWGANSSEKGVASLHPRLVVNYTVAQTVVVSTTDDTVTGDTSSISALIASNGGDGISLREAILASNNTAGPNTIVLPAGHYLLNSALPKIDDNTTITGAGARSVLIDGQGSVRVFEISKDRSVFISGLTIQNGSSNNGGGIFVDGGAILNLTDVRMIGNIGENAGGAIHAHGNIVLNRVLLDNNTAQEGGAVGIHNKDATASFTNVTFSGNTASNGEGGAIHTEGDVTLINSTVADNTGDTVGGIYLHNSDASATLANTILRNFGINAGTNVAQSNFLSNDFNIDSDGSLGLNGAHDLVADPMLGTLSNNGGQTDTYALLAGSPALNPGGLTGAPPVDQRNTARDGAPDIGAFEAASGQPVGAMSDSNSAVNQVAENAANGTAVGITATSSDPDLSDAVAYSLTNDAGGRFAINATTGVVTVANGTLLDYESATTHTITVRATSSDGSFSAQSFAVNLLPANDNTPVITSDGGGATASLSVAENTASVTNVTATDADLPSQTLVYALSGIDAGLFAINSSTGTVSFVAPPDFEAPADNDGDNVYLVTVQVSDGAGGIATQNLSITVTDVNESTSTGADLIVTAPSGPTTEGGLTATFQVSLARPPLLLPVQVSFTSTNPSEGVVLTGTLTFDIGNWNVPQTVTVQGVNDFIADGTQTFDVQFNITSLDLGFLAASAANLTIDNLDDDQADVLVSPISGPTTEAGGSSSFTIVLASQPLANVVIPIASGKPQEGTASVSQVTFTPANWNQAQTVTVTGADDFIADGTQTYSILIGPATSGDPAYQGMDPADVAVSNLDNDLASLIVSSLSGPTTEKGTTASFTVRLGSQPTATVTVDFTINQPGEASVVSGQLTFNAANWNVAQTVTIQGVDDTVVDGSQAFLIAVAATSADAVYDGTATNVSGINRDDDGVLIHVTPLAALTSEAGGTVQLSIVLDRQPTATVRVPIASLNLGEATTDLTEVVFTPANWNVPQIVTVTGQDDLIDDGDANYSIAAGPAISSDPIYSGAAGPTVALTNTDNEGAGIFIGPLSGELTEGGGTIAFVMALDSQPLANVVVTIISDDPDEAEPVLGHVTFTHGNWSAGRVVKIRGVDDTLIDGNRPVRIRFVVESADPAYDQMQIAPLSLVNADNDAQLTAVPPPVPEAATVPAIVEAMSPSAPASNPVSRAASSATASGPSTDGAGASGAVEAAKPPNEDAVEEPPTPAAPPAPVSPVAPTVAAPAITPAPAVAPVAPAAPAVAALPAQTPAAIVISQLQQQASEQAALLDENFKSIASLQTNVNPVVTAVLATTTVVSASYFLIAGRVFSWMLTVFAARPVWTRFDPLQILFAWEEEQKRRAEQEESLRSLVKN